MFTARVTKPFSGASTCDLNASTSILDFGIIGGTSASAPAFGGNHGAGEPETGDHSSPAPRQGKRKLRAVRFGENQAGLLLRRVSSRPAYFAKRTARNLRFPDESQDLTVVACFWFTSAMIPAKAGADAEVPPIIPNRGCWCWRSNHKSTRRKWFGHSGSKHIRSIKSRTCKQGNVRADPVVVIRHTRHTHLPVGFP